MKKFFVLCAVLSLNACVYAGEVDIWPGRKAWFDKLNSYSITYKNSSPTLVKEEEVNEKSFKLNELRTAFKGYSVLSDKFLMRQYYVTEKARANKNVSLNSSSAPYEYKKNEVVNIIGTVDIDGKNYSLVPTNLEDFVVLFDTQTGKLYPQTGMIKDERLVLLRQEFVPSDESFRFEPVFITKTEQSKPVKGFDIKFDGVRFKRMWFVYYDYASSDTGDFKEYSFPAKPGLVNIKGVKIRVLSVDDQRVDYMIIEG